MLVLLDGPRGNRAHVAPRQEVKNLVAQTLRGQPWDEAALDRVLAKTDSNAGPPMVDAAAFLLSQPESAPPTLALVAPALDPFLQCFVEAEKFIPLNPRSVLSTTIS